MRIQHFPVVVVPLFLLSMLSTPVIAEDWGGKMFDRSQINFGSVARLADTTFTVIVKNPYAEEIRITSLTTSCGCISWTEQVPMAIASRAERILTIRLDTVRHVGEKHVKAIVVLLEPVKGLTSTVILPVEGRIRDDFEVRPSSVAFGIVDVGSNPTQRMSITYKGRADWKLSSAKVESAFLTTQIVEKARTSGTVQYDVVVELKPDAPVGAMRDRLLLTTNEVGSPVIAIPIEARIENDIVTTDAQFGMVNSGHSKAITVILRGKKPFEIEKVEHIIGSREEKASTSGTATSLASAPSEISHNDQSDAFKIEFATGAIQFHMLTIILNPPNEPGMFDETFSVTIQGRNEPIWFHAKGRIQDPTLTSTLH